MIVLSKKNKFIYQGYWLVRPSAVLAAVVGPYAGCGLESYKLEVDLMPVGHTIQWKGSIICEKEPYTRRAPLQVFRKQLRRWLNHWKSLSPNSSNFLSSFSFSLLILIIANIAEDSSSLLLLSTSATSTSFVLLLPTQKATYVH